MRIFDLQGIKNSDKFMLERSGVWVVCQSTGESRMRIFILLGISGVWVYANLLGVKNENLHSDGDIRSLGVCQSTEELS